MSSYDDPVAFVAEHTSVELEPFQKRALEALAKGERIVVVCPRHARGDRLLAEATVRRYREMLGGGS